MISSLKPLHFPIIVLVVVVKYSLCGDLLNVEGIGENAHESNRHGPGTPLFLTPLIEKGHISKAVKAALVKPFFKNDKSYAGYFTVNKHFKSNLFFWFFPAAAHNWEELPVALWLQGGPGSPSLLGLLIENGPYKKVGKKLHRRQHSWHTNCNMIYIDSPVGTGFSFTESDNGYARNQTVISEQLYSAINQFFTLFPNLSDNEFYLAGESYAGKYIPELAYTIHKRNADSVVGGFKLNLKGLFIGNGLVDPANMMEYGDYVYQLGLIDNNQLKQFHSIESQIRRAIKKKRWETATTLFGKLVLRYVYYPSGSLYGNVTGLKQHYNYVTENTLDWNADYTALVTSDWFRRAVHVGDKPFGDGNQVARELTQDVCKSVIGRVKVLLNHYRILLYTGQLDVICAYPLKVNYLRKMKWSSAKEYATTQRHIWRVNEELAGYYKMVGNLTEVLVRAAGHMVPVDQPLWAQTLFNKFIYNKPLNDQQ